MNLAGADHSHSLEGMNAEHTTSISLRLNSAVYPLSTQEAGSRLLRGTARNSCAFRRLLHTSWLMSGRDQRLAQETEPWSRRPSREGLDTRTAYRV